MSRSRKKTPIGGLTTARSEKQDKRNMNKRLRRAVKMILKTDEREDAVLPIKNEIMDPWSMSKDGKQIYTEYKKPKCDNCEDKIRCVVDEDYKLGCYSWTRWHWYEKAMRK